MSVKCRADVCASIATVIALCLLVPGIGRGAQNSSQTESERLLHAASAAIGAGNYPEAEQLYTAAIRQIGKEGGTSARLPLALCGLGYVRRAAGQYGAAADLFLKAIQIMEAAPATEPEELGAVYELLGTAYYCQRLYSRAEKAYLKALDYQQHAIPASYSERVQLLASLGAVYTNQGRYDEAEALFQRAHDIADKYPPIDPLAMAILMNNRGSLYGSTARFREAEEVLRRGLTLLDQPAAPARGLAAHMLGNLALACAELKEYSEAAALFARAVDLIEQDTAMLEPDEISALFHGYGDCLRQLGRKHEAKQIESRAKTILSAQPREPATDLVVDASQFRERR